MTRGTRRWAAPAAVGLALLACASGAAAAAPSPFSVEVELSAAALPVPGVVSIPRWALQVHVAGSVPAGPAVLHLALDPAVWGDGSTHVISGVTEAYLELRGTSPLISVGIERLPLEVARLTLPFAVEPVDALGRRGGLPGLRASWFPDDATRLRLALAAVEGRFAPVFSLRRQFVTFEAEGHAAVLGGRTALGLGASGLVGRLVLYGEAWALTAPTEGRYAVGVSGALPRGLWTVEVGYAAALPGQPPRQQAAAQLVRRVDDVSSWSLTVRAFPGADGAGTLASGEYTRTFGAHELTVLVGGLFGPGGAQGFMQTTVRIGL